MLPVIVEAAINFCTHQIQLPYELIAHSEKKRTLLAYIDIESEGFIHRAFIGCDDALIRIINTIFLGEEENDEQTLVEMLLETANMIIGNAKVLASESYTQAMTISTPFFLPDTLLDAEADEIQWIRVDGGEMAVALKRL